MMAYCGARTHMASPSARVCVCVYERGRERESVCVYERVCVCVYESVCVCERERERVCVCGRQAVLSGVEIEAEAGERC